MKTILLLLSVVLCVVGYGRADQAAKLTANQILQKTADTYATLPSYSGGTAVVSVSKFKGGRQMLATSTAVIKFSRTGKLHVYGQLPDGGTYHIVGDKSKAILKVSFASGKKKPDIDETLKNTELAIAAATGIAQKAPTIIPAALLKLDWGYPFFKDTKASLLGVEKVGKTECYKIAANRANKISSTHCIYWIDTQSFLLIQMRDDAKFNWKELVKELPQKVQAVAKSDSRLQSILSTSSLFVFTNGKMVGANPLNQFQ